jgi:hypothetical protein
MAEKNSTGIMVQEPAQKILVMTSYGGNLIGTGTDDR